MRVVLDPPEELLAERRRLGLDIRDEVWEGSYHLVPPATPHHQWLGSELNDRLKPAASAQGLTFLHECGVYDPDPRRPTSYCVPDYVAFRPDRESPRGIEGRAELVIEIRSPGDETFQKLPFYERVGVQEFLVIDRDTKALRHWTRQNDRLVETAEGLVVLQALDARLWSEGDTLVIETATGTHRI